MTDDPNEKRWYDIKASEILKKDREAMDPGDRVQRSITDLAEAKVKRERAQKHYDEAQSLLQKAHRGVQEAEQELQEARRAAAPSAQPPGSPSASVPSSAAVLARRVAHHLTLTSQQAEDGRVVVDADSFNALLETLKATMLEGPRPRRRRGALLSRRHRSRDPSFSRMGPAWTTSRTPNRMST